MLQYFDGESAFTARHLLDLAQGEQFDIGMPADLDQFRGEDSHGAIIGRKGLVQLGHDTADGRRSFHQVDQKAAIGKIQSGLDAGNPTAYDHYRSLDRAIGLSRLHCWPPFLRFG
jgi:hypothetical protein